MAPSSADERRFLERLASVVGDEAIERGADDTRYFAEDALGPRGNLPDAEPPLAIVRPADGEAVARVLALCGEHNVPVVPYGAGTGLMGGARSVRRGIVLDTMRLKGIDVVAGDRLVWAGAGCVLADVDTALREYGFCLGHDPWTFPVATVGGTISTNSLGYKGGRYGGMGDQVIALEVALADGTLLRTAAVSRRSTGPALHRLFIGAEGTLGVITKAALRGHRVPEREELLGFNFDTFAAGFEAIDAIAALGLRPSLLDYGEEHASPWPELTSREEEPPLLYVGFEGLTEEVEMSVARSKAIIGDAGGRALPASAAQEFWDDRHVVAERFSRTRRERRGWRSPGVAIDYMHVALPPSKVLEFQRYCHAETAAAGVGLLECGLWTGPEMFSAVLALPVDLGGHERLGGVMDGLLRAAQDLGGSMEYVHGAGLRLAHLMAREHGTGLEVLRQLKQALDPGGILNPGKLGL